jgi:DNA-binding CsgD family transcriptional regulator
LAEFNQLSNREREVLRLLLQGKSNKLIALSLNVSVRTVEFHLKNIYAKFQVSSRIELILKLVNATGALEIEKLGHSTVDRNGEIADNRDKINSLVSRVTSFRDTISLIGKELEMKNFLLSKQILVGVITALFAGFLWVSILLYSHSISLDIKVWGAPFIIVLTMIGVSVGFIGQRNDISLRRIFFSTLFGTGLSPFLIIPLMLIVVLPLGKLAEWFSLIDPSAMSSDVATMLGAAIMIVIWLIVGVTLGVTLLFVTLQKPEQANVPGM